MDRSFNAYMRLIVGSMGRDYRSFLSYVPKWHPGPKELRLLKPYALPKYLSIVPRGTFNRKMLFPFSGYLPKRVRARIKFKRKEKYNG